MKRLIIEWALKQLTLEDKHRLLNEKVKSSFTLIDEEDLFKIDEEGWHYKNKLLTDGQIKSLKAEAEYFSKSEFYRMLRTEIRYRTGLKIVEESKDVYQIIQGKIWIYTLDVFKHLLKKINKS